MERSGLRREPQRSGTKVKPTATDMQIAVNSTAWTSHNVSAKVGECHGLFLSHTASLYCSISHDYGPTLPQVECHWLFSLLLSHEITPISQRVIELLRTYHLPLHACLSFLPSPKRFLGASWFRWLKAEFMRIFSIGGRDYMRKKLLRFDESHGCLTAATNTDCQWKLDSCCQQPATCTLLHYHPFLGQRFAKDAVPALN